jgi:hypothetical protein
VDLGAQLAQAVEIALRPADRLRVKGKSEAVDLFTLCLHPELRERQAAALSLFEALLADAPDDRLTQTYIERLGHFLAAPPQLWDGVTMMDAK